MKRIYRYIFILASLTLAASCVEKLSDEEILSGRDKTKLEVTYSLAGTEVKSVTLGHASVKKVLEVNVNSEGLKWNLESNRDWCKVVQEEHSGSGTVTLDIAANETFEEREPATLTFVAGDYRGSQIVVTQDASSLLVGQPYYVTTSSEHTYTVTVTSRVGEKWAFSAEDWMSVKKGTASEGDKFVTTPLTLKVFANDGASRFGSLVLSSGSGSYNVSIYQFGDDMTYDESGNILFEGGDEAKLTLVVPSFVVDNVKIPEFAKSSLVENGNGTATLTVDFEENLSDCSEPRDVEIELSLSDASGSVVKLPKMAQDYIPANGLVSAKGMVAFANAVAAGAPTSDWEDEGVVTVKRKIDMEDIADWAGIGTETSPFTGKFNGGNYEINNIHNTSKGLFAYCQGATISNVKLGKGCSFYFDGQYTGEAGSFGAVVGVAKETSVSGCEVLANIEYAGSSDNDEPAYVGGVVGKADEKSTVTKSKMAGTITVSTPATQMTCYAGGIVGYSEGTVTNNEMSGTVTLTSGVSNFVVGGITSTLLAKTVASGNSFMGTLTLNGASLNTVLGGLYGYVTNDRAFDIATDKSVTQGNIKIADYLSNAATEIYAGGFVGKAGAGVSLSFKGYETSANIAFDQKASRYSSYICLGGILGGCDYDNDSKAVSVQFENVTTHGEYTTSYAGVASYMSRGFFGGMAGLVNASDVKFVSCLNTGAVGRITEGDKGANKAGYIMIAGGIAGVVMGGEAVFTKCENKGPVTNMHYSNHAPEDSNGNFNKNGEWLSACTTAGILGTFDNKFSSVSETLKMTSCVNSGNIIAYRGAGAGIVGFARNAEITSCTNIGDLSFAGNVSNASHKGGIVAWVENATIESCVAKCKIEASNGASAPMTPGGILSYAYKGKVTVSNCSYYGEATYNTGATTVKSCGGIVGKVGSGVTFNLLDCKFGGKVAGTTISANNVEEKAIGSGANVSAGSVKYWNGNL